MAGSALVAAEHTTALLAAGGFEAEYVVNLVRLNLSDAHSLLRAVEHSLHCLDQYLLRTAVGKLLLCCALRDAEESLTLLSTLRAPGRDFRNLLRDWLDTKVSQARRESLMHDLQRIPSLIASLGDRIFWRSFSTQEGCHLRSFDQLIELDARREAIRRHCTPTQQLAPDQQMEWCISLREQFFRDVFAEVRTAAQTKVFVTSRLQATITAMQQEANAQQQQQQPRQQAASVAMAHEPAPAKRASTRRHPQPQLTGLKSREGGGVGDEQRRGIENRTNSLNPKCCLFFLQSLRPHGGNALLPSLLRH